MELLSELCEEEDEVTLYRLLREVSGVVDPCYFCKEIKSMYHDCLVDCSGWPNMDMLIFMYFMENPLGMTHAHTHSATIMNCNDKETYKFLMNKVFSITYIDRALIVKNYIDNELVKYHPHLVPIICWYNALLYRFYWPYSLKNAEKSTQMDWPCFQNKVVSNLERCEEKPRMCETPASGSNPDLSHDKQEDGDCRTEQ